MSEAKDKLTNVRIENFIDGKFVKCSNYMDSTNPATGKVWAHIPDGTDDDVNKAVVAAKIAFPL